MKKFTTTIVLATLILPLTSIAETDIKETPPFKQQAIDLAIDTAKEKVPAEYQGGIQNVKNIHKHINSIDLSKPDETAAHIGGIKKNLSELDDSTGATKKVTSSNYYNDAATYTKELYQQALDYWDGLWD